MGAPSGDTPPAAQTKQIKKWTSIQPDRPHPWNGPPELGAGSEYGGSPPSNQESQRRELFAKDRRSDALQPIGHLRRGPWNSEHQLELPVRTLLPSANLHRRRSERPTLESPRLRADVGSRKLDRPVPRSTGRKKGFQIPANTGHLVFIRIQTKGSFPSRASPSVQVHNHSTVTDFARLRGWSTSVPMKSAVW